MGRTTNEQFNIDLTDVFEYFFKKIILVFLICLLGAILAIGLHYRSANSEKSMQEFNLELNNYNNSLATAKNKVEVLNNKRHNITESMKEDPVVALYSADQVYVSNISFFINSNENIIISESGSIIYPNQEKLEAFFGSLDLSEVLNSSSKKEYLSKLVLFSAQRNHIVLTAFGKSREEAIGWVENVYKELYRFSVEENGWTISGKTDYCEEYLDQYIVDIVAEYNEALSEIDDLISEQSINLLKLESKKPHHFHFFRFGVIGFVVFGFLSFVVVLVKFVLCNPVTKSFIAEKKTHKLFIGALFAENSAIDKLTRKMFGERSYSSESEAVDFIKSNIKTTELNDDSIKNVAILCSCKSKKVEKQAKNLESILSEFGCKATLVTDVSVNPESADVVSSTDAVILLERQWVSQWKLVGVSMDLAERFDKPVVGFVLC